MSHLKRALKTTNAFLIFIPFLAITGIFIATPDLLPMTLIFVVLNMVLSVIVHARITENMSGNLMLEWTELFQKYWKCYLATTALIMLPILPIEFYLPKSAYVSPKIANIAIGAIVSGLTIYVLPFVFLQKRILPSIKTGLLYLYKKWYRNLPLILIVLIMAAIRMAILLLMSRYSSPTEFGTSSDFKHNLILAFTFGFIQNSFLFYLDLLLFTWALLRIIFDQDTNRGMNAGRI